MSRRLADLAGLKTYLGIPLVECRFDLALTSVLERVTPIVEDYLGEPVLPTEREYFFSGDGCCKHPLPFRRVRGVASVAKMEDDGEVALDPGTYKVQRYGGGFRLVHDEEWASGAEYVARLELGTATVPGAIQEVAIRMAADIVAKSRIAGLGDSRLGVKVHSEVVPGTEPASDGTYHIAEVTPASITTELAELLAPHKIITIPF